MIRITNIEKILTISFVIIVFAMIVALDIAYLILFPPWIFFMLNARRYLKCRRWYIDPTSWGWSSNEKTLLFYAWMTIFTGIFVIIVFVVLPFIQLLIERL